MAGHPVRRRHVRRVRGGRGGPAPGFPHRRPGTLANTLLALGRSRDAATLLQPVLAAHPFHESPWTALVLALYRSGRQAEALRAYSAARERLIEDFGWSPARSSAPSKRGCSPRIRRSTRWRPRPPPPPPATAAGGRRLARPEPGARSGVSAGGSAVRGRRGRVAARPAPAGHAGRAGRCREVAPGGRGSRSGRRAGGGGVRRARGRAPAGGPSHRSSRPPSGSRCCLARTRSTPSPPASAGRPPCWCSTRASTRGGRGRRVASSCAGAMRIRVLATSRQPLDVGGEVGWLVPALELADVEAGSPSRSRPRVRSGCSSNGRGP